MATAFIQPLIDAEREDAVLEAPLQRTTTGTKRRRTYCTSEDIPWTASRCNRLLRTIASRISILQELAASNRLNTHAANPAAENHTEPTGKQLDLSQAAHSNGSPSKDPEWLPTHAKGPSATTYGGKSKTKHAGHRIRDNAVPLTSDGLGISTPFVKRMLRPNFASPRTQGHWPSQTPPKLVVQKARKSRSLPIKPSSAAEAAYSNLVTALASFLHATSPADTASHRTGASSLRSACLRKVPAYVELEQHYAEEDESDSDDEQDIASELYDELEGYGTTSSGGWAGLREVVRADGLHRIRAAVFNGLLPVRIIETLVTACCRKGEVTDGLQLLTAALEADVPGRSQCLSMVLILAEEHSCPALMLRTTSALMREGILSVQELCAHKGLWHIFFRSMMTPQDRPDAVEFLIACIRAAWVVPIPDCDSTASNEAQTVQDSIRNAAVLLIATAAESSGDKADAESAHAKLGDAVRRVAKQATISCTHLAHVMPGLTPGSHSASRTGTLLSPFFVGSLILHRADSASTSNLHYLSWEALLALLATAGEISLNGIAGPASKPNHFQQDTIVSDVALTIGRWDVEAADTFFTETIGSLLQAVDRVADAAGVVQQLALTSARAYADARNDKNNLMFAEEVEDMVLHGARLSILQTPGNARSKRDSYRWEEGLCEWIARTPFSVTASAQSVDVKAANGDRVASSSTVSSAAPPQRTIELPSKRAIKRPSSDGEQASERVSTKRGKRFEKRALAEGAISDEESITVEGGSCDELDELAFSVKEAKKLQSRRVAKSVRNAKMPMVRDARVNSLNRTSSGSSSWVTLDTSDDELG
ncbi:hypothetical protein LTR85_000496 [Meristemomyces frigidus]|nr:hypothetical protein LTR85_000496 [Meristemomyces frigidus]